MASSCAYWTVATITLHFIAAIIYYVQKQSLNELTSVTGNDGALSGIISWAAVLIAMSTSFEFVRRAAYRLFYYTHIPMFIIFVVFGCIHQSSVIAYLVVPVILWGIDRCIRFNSTLHAATLISIKPITNDVTEIVFLKNDFRYTAGQYVYMSIDALGSLNAHPVSIASAPHEPYIRLYVRANKLNKNSWSNRLHQLGTDIQNSAAELPTLYVEGPYGSTDPHAYVQQHGITLIAGGIGITNIRSLMYDIVQHSNIESITLLWCIRDVTLLPILQETDNKIDNQNNENSRSTNPAQPSSAEIASSVNIAVNDINNAVRVDVDNKPTIHTYIYITDPNCTAEQLTQLQRYHKPYELYLGRPQFNEYMNGNTDIVVCGPESLLQETRKTYKLLIKNGHTCIYREDAFVM